MKIRYSTCTKKWIVELDVGQGAVKEIEFDTIEECEQWCDHADNTLGEILNAHESKYAASSDQSDRNFRTGVRNKFLSLKHHGMLGVTYFMDQCVEHILLA